MAICVVKTIGVSIPRDTNPYSTGPLRKGLFNRLSTIMRKSSGYSIAILSLMGLGKNSIYLLNSIDAKNNILDSGTTVLLLCCKVVCDLK